MGPPLSAVIQCLGIVTASVTIASSVYQPKLLTTSCTVGVVAKSSTKESLVTCLLVAYWRLFAMVSAFLSCAQEAQLVLRRSNFLTAPTSWLFTVSSFVFAFGTRSSVASIGSGTFSSLGQAIVA